MDFITVFAVLVISFTLSVTLFFYIILVEKQKFSIYNLKKLFFIRYIIIKCTDTGQQFDIPTVEGYAVTEKTNFLENGFSSRLH